MFVGHTRKECPNLLSTEITIETDVKKHKADYELKTFSIKKRKVGHFKKVVKQKAVTVNKNETLKRKKKREKPQSIK